jgi:NADH-quinone oxidoreductase subunit F
MTDAVILNLHDLDPILKQYSNQGRSSLIPVLIAAQEKFGYLSEPVVTAIGEALRVPLADIHGVIEFYTLLYREPVGREIVRICTGPRCVQQGSAEILNAVCKHFNVEPGETTSDGAYTIEAVPCLCLCDQAPAALVGKIPTGWIGQPGYENWISAPQETPLGTIIGEPRWLTGRCGVNHPTDLDAFVASGGYRGLAKSLQEMSPAEVIAEIKASGLVGRGGAAFPTGLKWEMTASAEEAPHYVVCNGDESEPGTFKDRVLLEGDPFFVIEGMTIAGYVSGAEKGYLFVRGEYPRGQKILEDALAAARKSGYLGSNILGSDFSFDIELRSGAGAYICGEETALFEAIEGKRGFPRLKPPYPVTNGLFGKPTVINNVETLCAATWILAHGADAYRQKGTLDSPGMKLFCLSGNVAKPGIVEAPFGITIRELIDMAGGPLGEVQAILLGGAAGKFAHPDEIDLEMSFEGLRAAGHSLGSGVVMVMNQEQDLRETLHSLAEFFAHESCGKCYPCRLGTQRQLEIVEKIAGNAAKSVDLIALEDVDYAMTAASICGLGMTAGLAIQSALKLWPELGSVKQ